MNVDSRLLKIAITGPESTGKTSLCQALALHFNAAYTNEYARIYLEQYGNRYDINDLTEMAKGQLALEDQAAAEMNSKRNGIILSPSEPALLFCDTDLHVIRIWSEIMFNACDRKILDLISSNEYDLFLLCKPDIAWVYDAQREHPEPEMREKIYHHYRDMLIHQSTPWVEVSGSYENRIETAITATNHLIKERR
jgi:NadR type nicotinamide-nucleotide adenylyltransferase